MCVRNAPVGVTDGHESARRQGRESSVELDGHDVVVAGHLVTGQAAAVDVELPRGRQVVEHLNVPAADRVQGTQSAERGGDQLSIGRHRDGAAGGMQRDVAAEQGPHRQQVGADPRRPRGRGSQVVELPV
jgi:hypothetical protein